MAELPDVGSDADTWGELLREFLLVAHNTDGTLAAEAVQDLVGGMVSGNTETGITVAYDDTTGKLDFTVTAGGLTTEEIQDIVGGMVSGNTETNITVTYDDTTGKLNFVASGVGSGEILEGAIVNAHVSDAARIEESKLAWPELFTVQAANQTWNASTTLAATELLLPLEADALYVVSGQLWYDASTVADMKIDWTLPTGATFSHGTGGAGSGATSTTSSPNLQQRAAGTSSILGGAGVGTILEARPLGLVTTDVVSGVLRMSAAQQTSEATVTTLRAGSWLKGKRVR